MSTLFEEITALTRGMAAVRCMELGIAPPEPAKPTSESLEASMSTIEPVKEVGDE